MDRLPVTLGVSLALMAGCGVRTALEEGTPAASGGAAGATTTTSSSTSSSSTSSSTSTSSTSSSSSSGAGGAIPVCETLSLTGPPITYAPTPESGSHPLLVPATEDVTRVSMVYVTDPPGPGFQPIRARDVTFQPWGAWPASLGTSYQFLPDVDGPLAVAPARKPSQPGFAALFLVPSGPFPADMGLAEGVATETAYGPLPTHFQWSTGETPARPLAVVRGGSHYLSVYQTGVGGFTSLGMVLTSAQFFSLSPQVACAAGTIEASTVPVTGGFLLATSSGRQFNACMLDDGITGPPRHLQVTRLDEGKLQHELVAQFEEPDPLSHVELARAADGAWLVWQNNGQSAFVPPPIRAVRLDESGTIAGPIFHVTQDGLTSGPIAAAALGDWLAVAWTDSIDPSSPTIRLDLFDRNGNLVAGASHNLAPFWLAGASLSLLPSADGKHLLLAWADFETGAPPPTTARVARFSCSGFL